MRVDVLKSLQMRIAPVSPSFASALRSGAAVPRSSAGNMIKLENFEKRYSLRRLVLVLTLSILLCGFLIKYLFVYFPKLQTTDMPLIGSGMFIVLLLPLLYILFYRPMVRQFDKLKRVEVNMRELALHDMLTGLYNRRGFLTFAERLLKLAGRLQRGLILIYADMDNLKQINDKYGHEAGDWALVSIADVLKETFRNSDVTGRVGGDEFAILALETKPESLDALRQRMKENLERAEYNVGSMHKLMCSLGIVYYNPQNPQTIEELLRKADMLMYEEKILEKAEFPK